MYRATQAQTGQVQNDLYVTRKSASELIQPENVDWKARVTKRPDPADVSHSVIDMDMLTYLPSGHLNHFSNAESEFG